MNQALKPASQNGRQTPLINQKPLGDGQGGSGGQGAGDWSKVLDANRAGAAMDADAFTKEKMEKGFYRTTAQCSTDHAAVLWC